MIRIAITGPESTGKSSLSEQLADHYQTGWVKEYARDYLEKTNGEYGYSDLLRIAKGQLHEEKEAGNDRLILLICDTDFIVLKIWSEVRFGKVHPWIQHQVIEHQYDLYLLCDIDLPWEYDPLREHPDKRDFLFQRYLEVLKENNFNFRLVSGTGDTRLRNAISFIDDFLRKKQE